VCIPPPAGQITTLQSECMSVM